MRWMAKKLNVSHAYISQILNGHRKIPMDLVQPLSEILDLDAEARTRIYHEVFQGKGGPFSKQTRSRKSLSPSSDWELVPLKDIELISDAETTTILMSTLLDEYDGTAAYIAKKTKRPLAKVNSRMQILKARGYLSMQGGVLKVSQAFFELQSHGGKEHLRKHHRAILESAINTLETKKSEEDLENRIITSATIACSKQDIARLKIKIADFLKEFVEEAASGPSNEIYHLGIQFFPGSRK